jgi:polar amino acid transport system substrate-binding protein
MFKFLFKVKLLPLLVLPFLLAAQCQPAASSSPPGELPPASVTETPTPVLYPPIQPGDGSDLVDHLLETGVVRVGIRVWPEPLFSPPAFRGFSNAATGGALNGFEVEVAHLLAERLGLELELVEAYPPVITSGDWRGQWDIAIASLVPFDPPSGQSPQLFFSQPYAYIPMGLLVPAESNVQSLDALSGKRVGVLEYSPYQDLLAAGDASTLTVQSRPLLEPVPADIQSVPLSNLPKAIRRLAGEAGNETPPLDAIFGPTPVLRQAVQEEWPVRLAAENLGVLPQAVAAVSREGWQVDRLLLEINQILAKLHQRGTLSEASLRWYGQDYTRLPPPTAETTP